MKNKRFTIDIPEDIHEVFSTIAFFKKVSMKSIILSKIEEVIREEREKGEIPGIEKKEK